MKISSKNIVYFMLHNLFGIPISSFDPTVGKSCSNFKNRITFTLIWSSLIIFLFHSEADKKDLFQTVSAVFYNFMAVFILITYMKVIYFMKREAELKIKIFKLKDCLYIKEFKITSDSYFFCSFLILIVTSFVSSVHVIEKNSVNNAFFIYLPVAYANLFINGFPSMVLGSFVYVNWYMLKFLRQVRPPKSIRISTKKAFENNINKLKFPSSVSSPDPKISTILNDDFLHRQEIILQILDDIFEETERNFGPLLLTLIVSFLFSFTFYSYSIIQYFFVTQSNILDGFLAIMHFLCSFMYLILCNTYADKHNIEVSLIQDSNS